MLFGDSQEPGEILLSNYKQILAAAKRTRCLRSFIYSPEKRLLNCLVLKMSFVNPKYLICQRCKGLFWLEIRFRLALQAKNPTVLQYERYGVSSPGSSAVRRATPWSRRTIKGRQTLETLCACSSLTTCRV